MINILSYVGMNMQSEVCLWTLLGLVRTIFDATLFKVNANLKQVWQMTMPEELTMPVQRVLRTMISGVMLVQCFTVYVYLASYIVLLYPVFLEERPTLLLPWLLLAAIRKLLCELTSLALGLGTCVLLGPARPPCIKFVVVKFTSIMPAFYMWMLVFSYYHALKVASAFKTFPAVLPPNDNDYGLELAVRRRRTKSLLGEEQLRKKLVANFYGETASIANETYLRSALELSSRMVHATDTDLEVEEVPEPVDVSKPLTISTTGWSDIGAYEDWFGSEVMIPRDTDRILEQIVLMLLRIGAYLKKEGIECIQDSEILNSAVPASWHHRDTIDCATMNADDTDTPPLVGSSRGNMASYLREYPQIFMKKANTDIPASDRNLASLKTVINNVESDDGNTNKSRKRATPDSSNETISVNVENVASKKKIYISDSQHSSSEIESDKLLLPKQQKVKETAKNNEVKRQKPKNKDSETQSKTNNNEITNKVNNGLQVYQITHENRNNESADATSSRISEHNISIQNSGDIKNQEITDLDPQIENVMKKLRARLQESRESLRSINNEDTTDPTSSRILDQSASYKNRDEIDKDVKIESKTQSKDDINHILDKVNNSSHVDEISSNENRNDESTKATSSRVLEQQASNHDSDEMENMQKNTSTNNKQS